jgi:hypothetical protein
MAKSPKSSSFNVRRLVIPPEVADRPFQTTLPIAAKPGVVYPTNSLAGRWFARCPF